MRRFLAGNLFIAVLVLPACPSAPPMASDGGTDASECTSDEACDDGAYCNGAEVCSNGQCIGGEPVACDDGIACTTDRCSEAMARCVSTPADADGDGHGDVTCLDDAGTPLGDDCDDTDSDRFAGNLELCDPDGHDEDCDPSTHGGLDEDGDGYESAACCNPDPEGGAPLCGDDCNDAVASVNPRGIEVCNQRDDDCDGLSDTEEGLALTLFVDADRDGYGDTSQPTIEGCVSQAGYTVEGGDCDDTDIARSPGQPEFCDTLDNDCDETVDEDVQDVPWYADLDEDGFGDASDMVLSCAPIPERSLLATDCDDTSAGRNPGVAEICNGLDDDCNGVADGPDGLGGFEDDDLDGVADLACGGTDCDDSSASVGALSPETCDGRDNDCDGSFDEGVDMAVFYGDLDRDGFGSAASGAFVGCGAPAGFVARAGDCADGDSSRFPGAVERCNGRDDDCDSAADEAPAVASCAAPASSPPGTTLTCSAGRCTLSCPSGTADCDGVYDNGCESTRREIAHCGSCGNACSSNHTSSVACTAAGVCASTCAPGYFDCNGAFTNDGCETPQGAAHCGGCGVRCPVLPRSVAGCSASGVCTTVCMPGFSDCDGNLANGCETTGACSSCTPTTPDCQSDGDCDDLRNDPMNCGACGRVCGLGAQCTDSDCDAIVQIAIGGRHTCALRANGQVLCWGDNTYGQVDPSPGFTTVARANPVLVPAMADAISISAGTTHTCALRASGRVTCWGDNRSRQLSNSDVAAHRVDVVSSGPATYLLLDAGGDHTCAATASEIECWGSNLSGESGAMAGGSVGPTSLGEFAGSGHPRMLALGAAYTCYGTEFEIANCFGAVPGRGTLPFSTAAGWEGVAPYFLDATNVTSLEAGGTHVCITTRGGTAYCRGINTDWQLGTWDGSGTNQDLGNSGIREAVVLRGAVELWLGPSTTCWRTAFGNTSCLGQGAEGALGVAGLLGGGSAGGLSPVGLSGARILAHGSDDAHVCAVDLSGRVLCWGHNNDAGMPQHRIGIGDPAVYVPEPVALISLGF